jgi:ribonuclease HI
VDAIQKVINTAARAALPVWRTTPNDTLCRDAGLPTAEVALEEVRQRFAIRLKKVDARHPLVPRTAPYMIRRGGRAGTPQRRVTKVQLAWTQYDEISRPVLASRTYGPGSRVNPTEGISKEEAAKRFKEWYAALPPSDIVAFTDGSKGGDEKSPQATGYGYAIYQGGGGAPVTEGRGALHPCSVVFDAEAVGAWRGLEKALTLQTSRGGKIWICVDNTATIWCCRDRASDTSQWAFLLFHEAAKAHNGHVRVKWSPGHMRIAGNERADTLARAGQRAEMDPRAEPTLAGIKVDMRRRLTEHRAAQWGGTRARLAARYQGFVERQGYSVSCPTELEVLNRPTLHRFLATRTGHGDYAWYHRRFNHTSAELRCECGAAKAPDHFIHCPRTRARSRRWPQPKDQPRLPLDTVPQRRAYLKFLMEDPRAFKEFDLATR